MENQVTIESEKNLYLFNKETNEYYILNGDLNYEGESDNASLSLDFKEYIDLDVKQIPPKVDLRPWMTTVENQKKLKTCTANAIAGAYEYLYHKTTGEKIDVSRLFIYYNSRVKTLPEGAPLKDQGSSIIHALETMFDHGVCSEQLWTYDHTKVNEKPPQECYDFAQEHRIIESATLDLNLDEIKICLAQGYPILASINLFDSFDKAKPKGIVPLPKKNDSHRKRHGRHAVLIVGYSDRSNAFIVRNSWGETWGDKGYCYIPYAYILNPKLTNFLRTVKRIVTIPLVEVGWCLDDSDNYTDFVPIAFGGGLQEEEEEDDDSYDSDGGNATIDEIDKNRIPVTDGEE